MKLTLLQRGVTKRLREAGYHVLSDHATECWRAGKPVAADIVDATHHDDLRADLARANQQVEAR